MLSTVVDVIQMVGHLLILFVAGVVITGLLIWALPKSWF